MEKDIIGYEGLYKINTDGKIFSVNRQIYRKTKINNCGYERITLNKNKIAKDYSVHRLVAQIFIEKHNNKNIHVNHKDGNKLNNHVNNLEWCTRKYNVIHSYKLGLAKGKFGIQNGNSKLTQELVNNIRSEKLTYNQLSNKYNISESTVWRVLTNRSWKDE